MTGPEAHEDPAAEPEVAPEPPVELDFVVVDAPRALDFRVVDAPRELTFAVVDASRELNFPIVDAPRVLALPIVDAPRELNFPIVDAPRGMIVVPPPAPRVVVVAPEPPAPRVLVVVPDPPAPPPLPSREPSVRKLRGAAPRSGLIRLQPTVTQMKQRRLGPEGPEVSEIGLGGMYMSITGRPDKAQAIRTIHAALDAGVTLIDTADVYCLDDRDIGHNERLLAEALAGRRERVTVATKGGLRRPGGDWTSAARPEQLTAACEASLMALGVTTIDLYQLHAPDPEVPFADSVGALARLREQGKVRLVGLSNVSAAELAEAQALVPIASVQNRWNPGHRSPEHDGVLAACTTAGIAFLPYSPFGGALVATRLGARTQLAAEAARRGISPHRLVLAWMLAKSPVVIPIPGARREQSPRDCAAASAVELSRDDVAAIESAF